MNQVRLGAELDFRDVLAVIDALSPDDADEIDAPEGEPTYLRYTFQDLGAPGTTLHFINYYEQDQTLIVHPDFTFILEGEVLLGSLESGLAAITGQGPTWFSSAPGSVIEAFGSHDVMVGEGRLLGRGGRDEVHLTGALSDRDGSGSAERSHAFGNSGDDVLKAAVQLSALKGGNGQDTLVLEFGTAKLVGGNHADEFVVDTGFRDLDGTSAQGAAVARGKITDFDGAEGDVFIFASVDDTLSAGDAPRRASLADRFGAGDMETLADFVDDGLTYRFRDNDAGSAVFRRFGTDGEGRTHDEKVIVKGVTLAEIDRADVVLQDHHAETCAFL